MRFWDSSAIVPLLILEEATEAARGWLVEDGGIVAWWGTPTECVSALARRGREGALRETDVVAAIERLETLVEAWHEVSPTDSVRRNATRLLRAYPLRAADALQLGAALVIADGRPRSIPFLTLDHQLADAASKEGFPVVQH